MSRARCRAQTGHPFTPGTCCESEIARGLRSIQPHAVKSRWRHRRSTLQFDLRTIANGRSAFATPDGVRAERRTGFESEHGAGISHHTKAEAPARQCNDSRDARLTGSSDAGLKAAADLIDAAADHR